MAVADVHPSIEELTAFTLGTLDEETQASIEAHVAACTSCQERAAVAPADNLVELVRRVGARTGGRADTFVEAAAQVQTPVLFAAVAGTEALAPAVAPAAPSESGRPEIPDAIPPELAHHERYRVARLLGAGGMGAVYEAEHRVMRRLVALKVIKRAYTASAAALERFRREVRAAARLSHPNIVTTYDAEDAGETHFLVMEYVEGTDLGRLVKERGPLPVDRACEYARQTALGLQHAFEQGMVHRDLKPHNLMLTPDGRVKILDFGLACFASEAASAAGVTGTGLVLGTVDYIAPEQADNPHEADIRSDIYSLGCTLYHLLAGRPPFATGTALQKVLAHREKNPQPLTELRPDLPEGFMPVLERMMAKDPRQRYQTPAEVAIALEPFTMTTAVARAPRPQPHARTTGASHTVALDKAPVRERRRPKLVTAVAVLAFPIVGLLGVAVYRIATDKGELVITTVRDDVKVVITQGGKQVDVIDTKTDKQIRLALRSGEYELKLKGAPEGLKLNIKKATLTRGKTVLATITWVGKQGDPLAVLPPPRRPPGGLVARWSANGNPKDSAGNNHGTLKGGVTFAPGVAGQAFDFNGTDAYVQIPNNANLNPGASFSVEFWVKANPSQPEALFNVLDKSHGSLPGDTTGWTFQGNSATGELSFIIGAGGGFSGASTGVSILDNQWHHIASVYTGNSIQMYLDGVLKSMTPLTAPPANNTRGLYFSKTFRGDTRRYKGLLDEVAIYDRALSPGEVKARWSALAPATAKVGQVRRFEGHKNGASGVAFSPDGRYVLSGGGDGTVLLREVATGQLVRRFSGHNGSVDDVAFSPDGRQALTASQQDKTARLWDVQTGKEIHILKGHTSFVYRVAFSPDGRRALTGSDDGTMRLWDLESGNELRRFKVATCGVAFSSDGRRALSGGAKDPLLRLWDVETGAGLKHLSGHKESVTDVVFLPGDRQALSCSYDQTLRLWDLDSGKEIRVFPGHTDHVQKVAITRDGRYALSASQDKTVRLWNLQTGKEVHCFTGHTAEVVGVAISPDGKFGLSGSWDNTVRLWRLPDLPAEKVGEVRRFEGHTGGVWAVALSADGSLALSVGGHDQTARLWKVATGEQLYCFEGLREDNLGVAFSPDSRTAFCSSGSEVRSWDVATGKERAPLRSQPPCGRIRSLAFSEDGRKLLAGGVHAAVLFDVQTGKELQRLDKSGFIHSAALSRDATQILTGADVPREGCPSLMRLWDAKTGQEMRRFAGPAGRIHEVAFSPDGKLCASCTVAGFSGGGDNSLRVFEMAGGKGLFSIPHPRGIGHGAFLPDGQRFLTACDDGVLYLWDVRNGQKLHSFKGHKSGVWAVAVSADGRYALTGSSDRTLRLWRLPDPPPAKKNP
jgi:WD40 repeat protein